jgi:uncharacterized membrane protein (UPF0127 family)
MRSARVTLHTASGAHFIDVAVAETPGDQRLGLRFRRALPDGAGMLFLHPAPREVTMWMKDTYLSLDMIFIDAGGRVHRIAARTEPLSRAAIASHGEVVAVLELAAGAAERLGLRPGDRVEHSAGGAREDTRTG